MFKKFFNEERSKKFPEIFSLHLKKAQEEMVGFALIVVLVAIILLVFLAISLNKPPQSEALESYEVENFIQAFLQYTSDCRENDYSEYFSVQDLIFECSFNSECSDGKDACEILNSTLDGILKESWSIGENAPNKGYKLTIDKEEGDEFTPILDIKQGDITNNYKGASQILSKRRENFKIVFSAYF